MMTPEAAPDPTRLLDPDAFAKAPPYRLWARMRAHGDPVWTPEPDGPGFWSLTRYDHAVRLLSDHDAFSVEDGTTLASLGVVLETARVEDDGVWATVSVGRTGDVRTVVDALRAKYPGTTLLARRLTDRQNAPAEWLQSTVERELTDRQRYVLEAAHAAGYFETPRRVTGSDLAASLGISQPTLSRHLRAAQRNLCGLLFRDER